MTRQTYRSRWEQLFRDYINLTCTEKAVGLIMSTYADPDGTNIYPGHLRLECNLSISQSTVKRATAALVRRGWIVKERTGSLGGTSASANVYRLAIPGEQRRPANNDQGSPVTHGADTDQGSPVTHGPADSASPTTGPEVTGAPHQGSRVHSTRGHGCAPTKTVLPINADHSALAPLGRRAAIASSPADLLDRGAA